MNPTYSNAQSQYMSDITCVLDGSIMMDSSVKVWNIQAGTVFNFKWGCLEYPFFQNYVEQDQVVPDQCHNNFPDRVNMQEQGENNPPQRGLLQEILHSAL